jgi:hypothetical protein
MFESLLLQQALFVKKLIYQSVEMKNRQASNWIDTGEARTFALQSNANVMVF